MKKIHSVLQPALEKLLEDKVRLEKLIAGPGRYEQHPQGRRSIVLERDDLIKQLKNIKAMIKAQKKFDKKTDPAIQQRKQLRAELMQLTKSKVADLYLNLRFSEIMIQSFHLPVYKKGLAYERKIIADHKKSRDSVKENNRKKVECALSSIQDKINISRTTKPRFIIDLLYKENGCLPLSEKHLIKYLKEIIESR